MIVVVPPPPHETMNEIANAATMQPNILPQRLFRTPQKAKASTGGSINGKPRNCGGLSFDTDVVVIVTTTAIAAPPDVRLAVAGLTLHTAPTTV